jgi:hypothetical protein
MSNFSKCSQAEINPPGTNAFMVCGRVRFVHGERTGYALRRKSAARTRALNCSGVSGVVSIRYVDTMRMSLVSWCDYIKPGVATLPGLRRGIAQAFGRTDPCPFLGPISRMITSFAMRESLGLGGWGALGRFDRHVYVEPTPAYLRGSPGASRGHPPQAVA